MKIEKIELRHLAGYLPYGLKAITIVDAREEFSHLEIDNYYIFDKGNIWTYCGYADSDLCIPLGEGEINGFLLRNEHSYADINNFVKPILHPLSDLTKEIEVNGKKFIPMDALCSIKVSEEEDFKLYGKIPEVWKYLSETKIRYWDYWQVQKLYEWKFDLHGLIESGLAIDINTLEK